MRLVFASHSADLLGAEQLLIPLVREATRRGHEVMVTTPVEGPLCDAVRAVGAGVEILPTRSWMGRRFNPAVGSIRLVQAQRSVPRYERFLASFGPDVVMTNTAVIPAPALAAQRLGIPHVWLVQESVMTNPTLRSALSRESILRRIDRLSASVVVLSEYVRSQVLEAIPEAADRLPVVPPPIDPPAQQPRRSYGATLGRVAVFGKITAEKGQADAVRALGLCARTGQEITAVFVGVGTGEPVEHLLRLAEQEGVRHLVETIAWTDNPTAVYHAVDATLMLSRNEAYGRVTAESLMSGTPVVGYRAGATTEIVGPGGGVLTDPRPDALAEALRRLATESESFADVCDAVAKRAAGLAATADTSGRLVDHLEQMQATRIT